MKVFSILDIQEITAIIRKSEINQILPEVTKLLSQILTIPATSTSCEIESFLHEIM